MPTPKSIRVKKWINKNKEKQSAKLKVRYAIRIGKIKKQPCEICSNIDSEAHHYDYSKPLEVRWLCRKHHKEEHGMIKKEYIQTWDTISKKYRVEVVVNSK